MALRLDQPSFVVDLEPGVQRERNSSDRIEGPQPHQLLSMECE